MADLDTPRRRFQFSLRTLLLLFIPVALLTALAKWLFQPPPIDVAMTVDRFSWYDDGAGHCALEAEVCVTNRSKHTAWYLENPRFVLFQLVDGKWLQSSSGTTMPGKEGQDWWSPQDGMQSTMLPVGAISDEATAMQVAIPFTTDRFMRKAHYVFSPVVKIVRRGQDIFPELEEEANTGEKRTGVVPR